MANITENITELQLQGDSTVYKLNDARITTTAVPTATHFLATDSSISSIAPITAANLASVLGGICSAVTITDFDLIMDENLAPSWVKGNNIPNAPYLGQIAGFLIVNKCHVNDSDGSSNCCQIFYSETKKVFIRYRANYLWGAWQEVSTDIPTFYKDYSTLAELKAALDAL